MRRTDREVTSLEEQLSIIERCAVCRIALTADPPYIVPMNFGWHAENGRLALFFHCATEGRKLELMARSPVVSFEMDTDHQLVTSDSPCGFGFRYASVMGVGRVRMLSEPEEKSGALSAIMRHMAGIDCVFTPDMVRNVCVLRLDVSEISAKRHA